MKKTLAVYSIAFCLGLFSVSKSVCADVLIIARPGPGGPAGMFAGQQIAHWPTKKPVHIVAAPPEKLPVNTDLVVDLVEDFTFRSDVPMANGATIRVEAPAISLDATVALAKRAAELLNKEIELPEEKFIVESKVQPEVGAPKIIVTTSTVSEVEKQRISKRTRQFRVAVQAILSARHVIDDSVTAQQIAAPAKPGVLRVAFYDDVGGRNSTGRHPVWVRETLRDQKDLDVYLVSAEDIRADVLNGQFDVLIMGGGNSRQESATLREEGKSAIRQYVQNGGGYVGICAGAFLAGRTKQGISISPATMGRSGAGGEMGMKLDPGIAHVAAISNTQVHSAFHGGPVISLAADAAEFEPRIWATFTENLVVSGKRGTDEDTAELSPGEKPDRVIPLANTPSVLASRFGKGNVVVFSPHCERAPGPQPLFWNAIRWSGKQLKLDTPVQAVAR